MGMERKDLRVEIKDADNGVVTAAFATLETKDHDDDWTEDGAFGEQEVRVSAYGHGSWMGELPVGKGVIYEKDGEARAELQFFMNSESGREHFEVVKAMGDLQEWSYGFDILETGELTEELEQKGVRRVIKKVKVHEVSPVLLGAGVGTRTLAVKALQRLIEEVDKGDTERRFELDGNAETVTEEKADEAEEKSEESETEADDGAETETKDEPEAEEKEPELTEEELAAQAEEEKRQAAARLERAKQERERLTRTIQRFGKRPKWQN